jgi:hypothetical protein
MGEEVKIRITTSADTAALEKTKQEIDRLKRAADEYDRKGMGGAATSARKEAVALQQNVEPQMRAAGRTAEADVLARNTAEMRTALGIQKQTGTAYGEAAQLARAELESKAKLTVEQKAQAGLHRAVSQEMREQEQTARRMTRMGSAATTFGREVAMGQNPMSGLQSAAMASGNPYVMGAAIAAALATAIAGTGAREADLDRSSTNREFERRGTTSRMMRKLRSWRGTSGAAEGAAFEGEEQAAGLRDQTRELEHKAEVKWWNPSTWTWGGIRKNEGQRGLEENAAQQADAMNRAREARKIAQEKFESEGGGLEIRGQQARISGNYKEAISLQELGRWYDTRRKLLSEGATEARAQEGANTELAFTRQERMRVNAERLINVRSGGADVARAAALADPNSGLRQMIDKLGTANDHLEGIKNKPETARF